VSDKHNIATYTLAASLFSLTAAFVYFTIELTRLANQAPAILEGIEKTSKQIEPVLNEFYKIRELIPPIVTEVTEIRKQIPKILNEVEQVRILVPPILVEVKKTREAIPTMLTKADNLVNNAGNIGKKSSEGAVSGVITGIIKAPFKLIGGTGKSLFKSQSHKISDKDRQLIEETALRVLSSANVGETQNWNNPNSGNNGVITLKEIKTIDKRQCSVLTLSINIKNSKSLKEKITSCLNDENKWELLKEDQ
jgi:surface antigen